LQKYRCNRCGARFSEHTGTMLAHKKTPRDIIRSSVAFFAHGTGPGSIAKHHVGKRRKLRTVMGWFLEAASAACRFYDNTVRAMECVALQFDEMWAYIQRKKNKVWVIRSVEPTLKFDFMPMVSHSRNEAVCNKFVKSVKQRLKRPEAVDVVTIDGLEVYVGPIRAHFKSAGYGQVVKKKEGWKLKEILIKPRYGRLEDIEASIKHWGLGEKVNTSAMERSNGTVRSKSSYLRRRSYGFSKNIRCLEAQLRLQNIVQNFCDPHRSLGRRTTPAMRAGLVPRQVPLMEILLTPL
jgi:IS1 family transposase